MLQLAPADVNIIIIIYRIRCIVMRYHCAPACDRLKASHIQKFFVIYVIVCIDIRTISTRVLT